MKLRLIVNGAAVLLLAGSVAFFFWQRNAPPAAASAVASLPAGFVIPALEGVAAEGKRAFDTRCATCHGPSATGTENGPPLVHKIYEPSHHGDAAFVNAPLRGVRAHHWPFGDMPPVEGIRPEEIQPIIAYVRTLQRANGIF